ncbi:uncharacterized protein LOC142227171 isoform X2 [Haematobia irritans]|uniref:uncharacterized protein LOC142227171 isoform X2 n=1 Tax=Haematobia irritans TaxID=7368 RepID=UPI003F5036AF
MTKRKRQTRFCSNLKRPRKNEPENSFATFLDLPVEVISTILESLDRDQLQSLRGTSKYLKDICDSYIIRKFQKVAILGDSNNMQAIKYCTDMYIQAGFESVFCGCILSILESHQHMTLVNLIVNIHHIGKTDCFLRHFYEVVESFCGQKSQLLNILHSITLMRLLKAQDEDDVNISSTTLRSRWVAQIQLHNINVDKNWAMQKNRKHLLIQLGTNLYRRYTQLHRILFGHFLDNECGSVLFIITVTGSDDITSLFRKCLEGDLEDFVWPEVWPKDAYTYTFDIKNVNELELLLHPD